MGSHPVAVGSNHLVCVVHASFVVLVVQDDVWRHLLAESIRGEEIVTGFKKKNKNKNQTLT